MLKGRKWYYRLVPKEIESGKLQKGLLSDHPKANFQNELIISMTCPDSYVHPGKTGGKPKKDLRLYSFFTSYIQFAKFQLDMRETDRCFYEIIFGEASQKPHFDIDIDDPNIVGDNVRDSVITSILSVLSEKGVTIELARDLLIYTSHGKNKIKQSYHIVINNYCHLNNLEAKAFYEAVTKTLPEDIKKWVDHAVYGKTQQFRVVGSQKIGSGRIKTLNNTFTYNGVIYNHSYVEEPDDDDHEMLLQLEEGLVGFASGCSTLPPFSHSSPKYTSTEYENTNVLEKVDADEAIDLLAKAGNIQVDDERFPYKFNGISGPIVMLKRIKASVCKICHRLHENENPYLLVVGDERHVYFNCRRNPEKKLYLGKLSESKDNDADAPKNISALDETTISIGTSWAKDVISRMKKLEHLSQTDVSLSKVAGKTKAKPKMTDDELAANTSKIFQQAVQNISSHLKSKKSNITLASWDEDDI